MSETAVSPGRTQPPKLSLPAKRRPPQRFSLLAELSRLSDNRITALCFPNAAADFHFFHYQFHHLLSPCFSKYLWINQLWLLLYGFPGCSAVSSPKLCGVIYFADSSADTFCNCIRWDPGSSMKHQRNRNSLPDF